MSDHIPFDRVGFFPSFPQPVQPPSTDIKASPTLALCFNEEWLPLIMGAVKVLMRPETYKGTVPEIIDAVANASQLVAQIGDCENMRTYRQDACHLYTTLNGIETLIYNGQECIDAALADGKIAPANTGFIGNPGPAECHTYTVKITTDQNWIAPNVVNTGDTILLSNWQGGATDLGMLSTTWTCPSGTAYSFGGCSNTARANTIYGTDPLQTAPHLAVIAQIGNSYYDVWNSASGVTPATFTVPSGIQNQPLRLLMNVGAAVGLVAAGEMWGEVTICNEHEWCHTWDFTTAQGPFHGLYGSEQWVSGVGWQTQDSGGSQIGGPQLDAQTTFYLSRMIVYYTNATADAFSNQLVGRTGGGPDYTYSFMSDQSVGSHTYTWDLNGSIATTQVHAGLDCAGATARNTVTRITLYGTGTSPFGTSNC